MDTRRSPIAAAALVAALLMVLAILRAPDHDESQYVASAVLGAKGLLPYRDFAYLQTPLQPLLFAPVAALFGSETWLALRIVNALLGAVVLGATYAAARAAGSGSGAALVATGLLATCDAFLFSVATARNDALPAALSAVALALALGRDRSSPARAALIGLLLAAAAAAKISYALPAAALGLWSLLDRRRQPLAMMAGALPVVILCVGLFASAPAAAWFEVVRFPTIAPSEYYAAAGRGWKLSLGAKLFDLTKFMLLGPAAFALVLVLGNRLRAPRAALVLLAAGLAAAALPTPTWRQYLVPALPPLFVLLACQWSRWRPTQRTRWLAAGFALIGILPTAIGLATMPSAMQVAEGNAAARAAGAALNDAGYDGPVATLSPQFLPAMGRSPDPRFAAGPFYFRSRALLSPPDEEQARLLSHDRLAKARLPGIVLVGGEDEWTSGEKYLDDRMERAALNAGYRRLPGNFAPFRIYVQD